MKYKIQYCKEEENKREKKEKLFFKSLKLPNEFHGEM